MRQASSTPRILTKLLERIRLTEDVAVQRQLMRMHGFSMMSMLLNEYKGDDGVVKVVSVIVCLANLADQ
jgi:Holliday junction resolvasome RuvABC ATP-dependent DNA helicase subunit